MTDTTERSSTTRLPAAERRGQLLQVALDTFAAKGFHETSMNEVAEAAGVTKPVLYQHFASKKALYNELVDEMGAELERAIFEAAAEADGPRQQVEAGFRAYFRWAIGQRRGVPGALQRPQPGRRRAGRRRGPRRVGGRRPRRRAHRHRRASATTSATCWRSASSGIAESTSRHWLKLGLGPGTDADAFADKVARLAWSGLRGITP